MESDNDDSDRLLCNRTSNNSINFKERALMLVPGYISAYMRHITDVCDPPATYA